MDCISDAVSSVQAVKSAGCPYLLWLLPRIQVQQQKEFSDQLYSRTDPDSQLSCFFRESQKIELCIHFQGTGKEMMTNLQPVFSAG